MDGELPTWGSASGSAGSGDVDVILTTGGTGITGRDVTPEAVTDLFESRLDGIEDQLRAYSRRFDGAEPLSLPARAEEFAQAEGALTAEQRSALALAIENVDAAGTCGFNYACVYSGPISWSSATTALPAPSSTRARERSSTA